MIRIVKVKNYEEMSMKAANIIVGQINLCPKTVLGLATGSTPIGTYDQLVIACKNNYVDFSKVTTINLMSIMAWTRSIIRATVIS